MTTSLDSPGLAGALTAGASPESDAHTLLGVTPDAPPDLALGMYWRRVAELRVREAAGDPDVVADLGRLNEALSLILGRTAADGREATEPTNAGDAVEPDDASTSTSTELRSAWQRAVMPGGVAALALACACAAAGAVLPAVAIVPGAVALLVLGRSKRRAMTVRPATPFDTLQLADHATADDVDLAYRTLVSRWLGRLTVDPEGAIATLDALERAYPQAMALAISRASAPAAPATDDDPVDRASERIGPADRAVRADHTDDVDDVDHVQQPVRLPAPVDSAIDIQRRLHASFDAVGDEVAGQQAVAEHATDDEVPGARARTASRFAVVIEAAAGDRKIPVEGRPITVGAGGEFDIAVGPTPVEGPRPYGRFWVNGADLVLHASAAAECRVNGDPSSWARLEDGDLVELAGLALRVRLEAPAVPA